MAIENISDTARWVAAYRAIETERRDALFSDPFAKRLAGPRGFEIVDKLPHGRRSGWSMVTRTVLVDAIVRELVGRGADLVINLAAGLDARPWRLDLPRGVRWVDVDLPDILRYKTEMLADERPRMPYEAIVADLRDAAVRQALLTQLASSAKRALVITEGLLIYLTPEQVAALARDLHAQRTIEWWTFDIISPRVLQWIEKSWGKMLRAGNAPFQFAPAESSKFFAPFGWREMEFRSMVEESHRINRSMPMGWLWRLMARFSSPARQEEFRRSSGMVVLERA